MKESIYDVTDRLNEIKQDLRAVREIGEKHFEKLKKTDSNQELLAVWETILKAADELIGECYELKKEYLALYNVEQNEKNI